MNLDDTAKQHGVCSLELSKELEAKGMVQGRSVWVYGFKPAYLSLRRNVIANNFDCIDAPHATEIAEILKKFRVMFGVNDKGAWINYDTGETWSEPNSGKVVLKADTLPNALARMVLYLLDKGIIKSGQVVEGEIT
jgi:hypothetical protein